MRGGGKNREKEILNMENRGIGTWRRIQGKQNENPFPIVPAIKVSDSGGEHNKLGVLARWHPSEGAVPLGYCGPSPPEFLNIWNVKPWFPPATSVVADRLAPALATHYTKGNTHTGRSICLYSSSQWRWGLPHQLKSITAVTVLQRIKPMWSAYASKSMLATRGALASARSSCYTLICVNKSCVSVSVHHEALKREITFIPP